MCVQKMSACGRFLIRWLSSLSAIAFLFAVDLGITSFALISDPGKIPHWLAVVTIVGALVVLILNLFHYLFQQVKESWRRGLLRFVLLYFCLLTGFASGYYLLSKDFYIQFGPDLAAAFKASNDEISRSQAKLDELRTKAKQYNSEGMERAKLEYDSWNRLERERQDLLPLDFGFRDLGRTDSHDRGIDRLLRLHLDFGVSLSNSTLLDPIREQEGKLDQKLISQYAEYQAKLDEQHQLEQKQADAVLQEQAEKRKYSYFSYFYFSTATIATVGYGDIYPLTRRARFLVTVEILSGVALVLVYLTLVLGERRNKSEAEAKT